jgi:hypothetical protein
MVYRETNFLLLVDRNKQINKLRLSAQLFEEIIDSLIIIGTFVKEIRFTAIRYTILYIGSYNTINILYGE